jgi:hypothetical protein
MHTQPWYIALTPMTRDSGIIPGKVLGLVCLQYQSPFPFFLTVPLPFIFVMVCGSCFLVLSKYFQLTLSPLNFCTGFYHSLDNDVLFVKHFLLYCFYQCRFVFVVKGMPNWLHVQYFEMELCSLQCGVVGSSYCKHRCC